MIKSIYLAGGCFWGVEELFKKLNGVINTEVGYTGGEIDNPTYDNHEGHAEAIKIDYDEEVISYIQILDYFFRIHDPSTLDRQGNDIGDSYRSAIFYQDEKEKDEALKVIDKVNQSGLYENKVVTKLEKFKRFWRAEEYHQDYLKKNPNGYTCHYLRSDESIL